MFGWRMAWKTFCCLVLALVIMEAAVGHRPIAMAGEVEQAVPGDEAVPVAQDNPNAAKLVAQWNLDDGKGSTLREEVSKSNAGAIDGAK